MTGPDPSSPPPPAVDARARAWQLQRSTLVVDTHVHGRGLVPRPMWALYRLVNRRSIPAEVPLSALPACGVDAVVATAVGDPLVTRLHRGPPMEVVGRQLDVVRGDAAAMGARIATSPADLRSAHAEGRTAVVLGVEGADMIGTDLANLDRLHGAGVRLLGLVHFSHNALGTICMPWQELVVPHRLRGAAAWATPAVRRLVGGRRRGLTAFGGDVVDRMAELGMVVDLAHADEATVADVCRRSPVPVVCSHTGARAVREFGRFISDDAARAIAATGGVVGLWPFRFRSQGVRTVEEWTAHARHLVRLVGADHVAIGTDMNGVPAVMDGYGGELEFPVLTEALGRAGLADAQVEAVLGGNFLRVFDAVTSGAR